MSNRWTNEEVKILIEHKNLGVPLKEIPLNRKYDSIRGKIRKLIKDGLLSNNHSHYEKWTEEQIKRLIFLRAMGFQIKVIARVLGKTERSVQKKISTHKQIKASKKEWTDEELLELVSRYRTQDNLNHNRVVGEPSSGIIHSRFGSWTKALKRAGLEYNKFGLKPNKLTLLYLVDFGEFKKVGITQRSIEERLNGFPEYKILDCIEFEELEPAEQTEREILNRMKLNRYIADLPNGNSECFVYDCTELSDLL